MSNSTGALIGGLLGLIVLAVLIAIAGGSTPAYVALVVAAVILVVGLRPGRERRT